MKTKTLVIDEENQGAKYVGVTVEQLIKETAAKYKTEEPDAE